MVYVKNVDFGNCYVLWEPAASRGTFAAPALPTNAGWIAPVARLTYVEQFPYDPFWAANKISIDDILKAGKAYMMQLFFSPVLTHSINFLKFAFSESAGSGSALSSCSLAFSKYVGAATNYVKLKNCQVAGASIGFADRGVLTARVDISGILSAYNSSAPTNWTLISDPATAKLLSTDGGASSFTIHAQGTGATITPKVESLFFTTRSRLDFVEQANQDTWADNPVANIERRVTFVSPYEDDAIRTLVDADTYFRAFWTIKTGTHTIEMNHLKFSAISDDVVPGVIRKPYTMVGGKSCALS